MQSAVGTSLKDKSEQASSRPFQTTEPAIRESIEVDDPTDVALPTCPEDTQPTQPSTSEEETPRSPWGLPVSKFSSNEPRSPTSPATQSLPSKFSIPEIAIPTEPTPALPNSFEVLSAASQDRTGSGPLRRPNPEIRLPNERSRRQASVGRIQTDLTKTTPLSEVSDPLLDDDLMDELQSATVQEAKPMSVSKSPINPVFPNSTGGPKQAPQLSRAVSNPMRGPLLAPSDVSQSSARSVSKNNVGSSISQRIKALEKLSGAPPAEDARPRTATPSSTFFGIRRPSIKEPSRSRSVAERADSKARHTPTPEGSREVTPETPKSQRRERSLSVASRLSMFEMPTQNSPRGRPESIQVTARIIRDPSHGLPKKPDANANTSEFPQVELKQSPLVVDLQRADLSQPMSGPEQALLPTTPNETIQERRDKKSVFEESEKKKRRRSSLSVMKGFIKDRRASIVSKSTDNLTIPPSNGAKSPNRPPSSHQNSGSFVRRLSISSRRSSISRERDNASTASLTSPAVLSDSGSENDKTLSEKSKKRASRFIRRLSNSFSGNRKNTSPHISPTVAEEDADQLAAASMTDESLSSQPAVVAYMGDVNVQFPDNLLWKRRSMCLDTQGFLFLSAVQGVSSGKDKAAGALLKRYHLSDFRSPYIPDVEIQELPNSVVLDLVEGSSLQIACEDRAGQLNILNALQDAHQSHSSFGQ
ncbi:hypothetical protein F4804DRAFT_180834 [Jackrogersella minutella]|nr:hypothetical protein F4804DRAFT_180834 [Jackrogersella minutella]